MFLEKIVFFQFRLGRLIREKGNASLLREKRKYPIIYYLVKLFDRLFFFSFFFSFIFSHGGGVFPGQNNSYFCPNRFKPPKKKILASLTTGGTFHCIEAVFAPFLISVPSRLGKDLPGAKRSKFHGPFPSPKSKFSARLLQILFFGDGV